MRSLYLRIYLTVLVALALFALVSGWVVQRHLDEERSRVEAAVQERMAAWGELLQRSLPGSDAPAAEQAAALDDWSQRLRVPLALDDARGQRIATSSSYARREAVRPDSLARRMAIPLDDGRTLWVARLNPRRLRPPPESGSAEGPDALQPGERHEGMHGQMRRRAAQGERDRQALDAADLPPGTAAAWWAQRWLPDGLGLVLLLGVLFLAVAAGAFPVVRRLTRRLEALKQGVEAFGAGQLHQRVAEDGRDEVAAVGASFNRAATRIEALLRSHQSLLANASHELRSPLARLKMATQMLEDAPAGQRAALRREIHANIAELDALVEEVLLASRLDAGGALDKHAPVDLLPLAAEEAARVGASAQGEDLQVLGDERLLRRALRNLLENAQRYGRKAAALGPAGAAVPGANAGSDSGSGSDSRTAGSADTNSGEDRETDIQATVTRVPGAVELRVCDRGPGVPEAYRERIFEAFFRMPGHAEREGGVGLGLALVRQIAQRHGGSVRCLPREGGGSCFVLSLPLK